MKCLLDLIKRLKFKDFERKSFTRIFAQGFACLLFLITLSFNVQANEDLVVVTNPQSGVITLSKKQVIDIYMGRTAFFPNNERAVALDHAGDSELKTNFYQMLIKMDMKRVNAYWSRLLFSGRATPPQSFQSTELVVSELQNNPNAIAYMARNQVPKGFNIVYEFSHEDG